MDETMETMQPEETVADEQLTKEQDAVFEGTLEEELDAGRSQEQEGRAQAEAGEETDMKPTQTGAQSITQTHTAQQAASQAKELIERLAHSAGMRTNEFIQNAERMYDRQKVHSRVNNLVSQGIPMSLATHVARTELENSKLRQDVQLEDERKKENSFMQSVRRLEERCPEVSELKQLPKEVVEGLKEGLSPMEAYQLSQVRSMEKELRTLRQEKKNREKSTGSLKGERVDVEDEFVRALMREY